MRDFGKAPIYFGYRPTKPAYWPVTNAAMHEFVMGRGSSSSNRRCRQILLLDRSGIDFRRQINWEALREAANGLR